MKQIERPDYVTKLMNSRGNGLVKVITGPRRCGKSYLIFQLFRNQLLKEGVKESNITQMKLDELSNAKYRNVFAFLEYFKKHHQKNSETNYFLIDEIQFITPIDNPDLKGQKVTFYDAINEMMNYENTEIFITGSNSHLLSSDIATEFRGRDFQIRVHPFSFKEYISALDNPFDYFSALQAYLKFGGLPGILEFQDESGKKNYLNSVYKTAYLKDVIDRHSLKSDTSIQDVTRIIATSVGSLINPNNLSNTFRSIEKTSVSSQTIKLYMSYLTDAFLISKAQRFDLKGKEIISGNAKYYFEDLGLRYAAAEFLGDDILPHLMENCIYNELRTDNYQVDIGIIKKNELIQGKQTSIQREIDFVVTKPGMKYYIQSAYLLPTEEKRMQEKKSLLSVCDGFKKIIISLDSSGTSVDEDGIYHINLFDFLLKDRLLETL